MDKNKKLTSGQIHFVLQHEAKLLRNDTSLNSLEKIEFLKIVKAELEYFWTQQQFTLYVASITGTQIERANWSTPYRSPNGTDYPQILS